MYTYNKHYGILSQQRISQYIQIPKPNVTLFFLLFRSLALTIVELQILLFFFFFFQDYEQVVLFTISLLVVLFFFFFLFLL